MDPSQQLLSSEKPTTRRGRGWRLTKASWRLVRRDPTVVPLSLLALGCFVIATVAAIAALDSLVGQGREYAAQVLLVAFAGGVASYLVLIFFCLAIAHAASGGFEGQPLTMREAIAEARASTGPAVLWALIGVAVTIGLQLVGATGGVGSFLGAVGGVLWYFLVPYVIPIIGLAGAGAGEAIGESAYLARRRWGEQLTGGVAIFVLTMVAAFVGGLLAGLGSRAADANQEALAAALVVIGGSGLAFTVVLSFATAQTFVVALYRFDAGELSLPELESPPPAAPIGRRPVFRIAGIIAALLVMATLVGALLPTDRDSSRHDLGIYTPDNGWYYATFPANSRVPLPAGSPVVYRERQVGVVIESRLEPSRVVVWFRASPKLEEPIESNPKRVGGIEGRHYLQVGPDDLSVPGSTRS